MGGALEGVRVVEVSAWAYVPSCGAILAEWGAEVIKIEPPTGDPIRGLVYGGVDPSGGISYSWELFNRGKKGMALDLSQPQAREIILELCASADIYLTSHLPSVRRKFEIDIDDIRAVNPSIIYAIGTGQGARGPEAEKGGYDGITFWARGSISSLITPPGVPAPLAQPSGAFGDSLSGMALAGGIAAALTKRERTGETSVVHGALFATAIWATQMATVASHLTGASEMPKVPRTNVPNPLAGNSYQTSDGRWVVLSMLQPDLYWVGFCVALGREDLAADERFSSMGLRAANAEACVAELDATFARHPLSYWRTQLATQKGQWDVVNRSADVLADEQARINGFIQDVDYGSVVLPLVAAPVQMDMTPPVLVRAPEFSENSDEVLFDLGWDQERILQAKIDGAVL